MLSLPNKAKSSGFAAQLSKPGGWVNPCLFFVVVTEFIVILALAITYGSLPKNKVTLGKIKPQQCWKAIFDGEGNSDTDLIQGSTIYCSLPDAYSLYRSLDVDGKTSFKWSNPDTSFTSWIMMNLTFNGPAIDTACGNPESSYTNGYGAHVHAAWPFADNIFSQAGHSQCVQTGEHEDVTKSCGPAGSNVCGNFYACDCSTASPLTLGELLKNPCTSSSFKSQDSVIQKRGATTFCKMEFNETAKSFQCNQGSPLPSPSQPTCQNGVVTPAFASTLVAEKGSFIGQQITPLGVAAGEFSRNNLSFVFHCPAPKASTRFVCGKFVPLDQSEYPTFEQFEAGMFAPSSTPNVTLRRVV